MDVKNLDSQRTSTGAYHQIEKEEKEDIFSEIFQVHLCFWHEVHSIMMFSQEGKVNSFHSRIHKEAFTNPLDIFLLNY